MHWEERTREEVKGLARVGEVGNWNIYIYICMEGIIIDIYTSIYLRPLNLLARIHSLFAF